jgi:hypothetical protein
LLRELRLLAAGELDLLDELRRPGAAGPLIQLEAALVSVRPCDDQVLGGWREVFDAANAEPAQRQQDRLTELCGLPVDDRLWVLQRDEERFPVGEWVAEGDEQRALQRRSEPFDIEAPRVFRAFVAASPSVKSLRLGASVRSLRRFLYGVPTGVMITAFPATFTSVANSR